jgi:hypothetical protein
MNLETMFKAIIIIVAISRKLTILNSNMIA